MAEIELIKTIAAPPAVVWDVIADLDASPDYTRGISAVERLDGGGEVGVGTRWRETRVMLGREATEELEITALDPGRSYTVEADNHGAHYRTVLAVVPHGEKTDLTMTFAAEPSGLVGKVMATTLGKLFEGATRKALEADLDDIEAEALRRASAG